MEKSEAELTREAELTEKVEALQNHLLDIYKQVYETLSRVERTRYEADALAQLDSALEPVEQIQPARAIAVLKALIGSTPADKIQLERFYGAPFNKSMTVGNFVHDKIHSLGLKYHDFWPFLRKHGWLQPGE